MASRWPKPEDDSWTRAHDCLRLDMDDTMEVLVSLQGINSSGRWQPWMGQQLVDWWTHCSLLVESHHDHEEHLFFPKLEEKIKIPARMAQDHTELLQNMAKVTDGINGIAAAEDVAARSQLLEQTLAHFEEYSKHMKEHLLEEEQQVLPLMHKNFTPEDFQPIVKKMVGQMEWYELPWFLRPLGRYNHDGTSTEAADRARKEIMVSDLKMPGFVASFMMRRCKTYAKQFISPMMELKDPTLYDPNRKDRCSCVVM